MTFEITVEPWTYRVSPFPAGSEEGRLWVAWIKAMGDGRWKVHRHYQSSVDECLTTDGSWWSSDPQEFICFTDLEEAKRRAAEAVPLIRVGGFSYADAVERFERGDDA